MLENEIGYNLSEIDRKGKVFYAIRGAKPRIEVKWAKIVNYNFRQKQGHGNAFNLKSVV